MLANDGRIRLGHLISLNRPYINVNAWEL
jgi:hypothetical protein